MKTMNLETTNLRVGKRIEKLYETKAETRGPTGKHRGIVTKIE